MIVLADPHDFDEWRLRARSLLGEGREPDGAVWGSGPGGGDMFAAPLPAPGGTGHELRIPRTFPDIARTALLHTDPRRHGLLYGLLWRLQGNPRLLEDGADADVRAVHGLVRSVRREIHKMRAFVRFRSVLQKDGAEHHVAWFEPRFPILRANAPFFVNRFGSMIWSILTPLGSLHWDGAVLREGPPANRADAPGGDDAEDLWRTYYASIFNPARLKVGTMLREMPRRYWANLPEAGLIPALIAGAQAREAAMITAGASEEGDRPNSLAGIAAAIHTCRRCPIGCNGTRAVMGEGPGRAALMIVGEQPGDQEEQAGRPFVGPAGKLLRAALGEAGIDAERPYVTNAVKHFKFTPTGKRRLHQSPTAGEIDTCRWWLDGERELVRPQVVLALGASAARGLLGRTVSVGKERGRGHELPDGGELWLTSHPSYLLRLKDEGRAAEQWRFVADLHAVAERLAALQD